MNRIIITALALASLVLPAAAQDPVQQIIQNGPIHRALAAKKATTPGVTSTAPAAPALDPFSKLIADIENIKQEVIAGALADIAAADADASTVDQGSTEMRDLIAHTCYPALTQFLKTLPTAQPLQGTYVAVQLHQRARDLAMQIKAGLPNYLKIGCAPMIGDDLAIITQGLGLVGVTVAGGIFSGGLAPLALPLPAL